MSLATARRSNPRPLGGRRVTLMGLGRHGGGIAAAKFLAAAGAELTISDQASAESLQASLAQIADLPLRAVHVGGHRERDFREADVVVVNPAIPPDHPCLQIAREAGAALTSEIELFLERCPARVVGVSGSNGKSTTCTLLAEIFRAAGRRTWLGGNIGVSLLPHLGDIGPHDEVVLELSSFQLAHLSPEARLPEVSLLTNCTPNHLDWHNSFAAYAAAKQRLTAAATAVVNQHDPVVRRWATPRSTTVLAGWPLERIPPLLVPGEHNRQNAALAAAAAETLGVPAQAIAHTLASFGGLPHRLQWVGESGGYRFYSDSKSTSPAATLAALEAMHGPVWLLAGGVSKGVDFAELAQAAARVSGVALSGIALFGQDRHHLAAAFARHAAAIPVQVCSTLGEAFQWCVSSASPGAAILLSPACASFDEFHDFEHRGRCFESLVAERLAQSGGGTAACAPLLV